MSAIVPISRDPITVRPAVASDLAFIDALQKKHSKQLGFMSTKTLQGKIELGHVLVAETRRTEDSGLRTESDSLSPQSSALSPLGYAIGTDRYHKHDDIGVIYQLNARQAPVAHRCDAGQGDVRSRGVRVSAVLLLVCAGHRGESVLGIDRVRSPGVPRRIARQTAGAHLLAEAHSRRRHDHALVVSRRRPPAAIGEGRLVLPIPPGTHWSDAKPSCR
jgi:hypothetical protein